MPCGCSFFRPVWKSAENRRPDCIRHPCNVLFFLAFIVFFARDMV